MTTETLTTSELFQTVYTRYFARVRAYIVGRGVRDWATAEDLAQDTFTRLWRDMDGGRIPSLTDIEHLSGFLITRANWVALSYFQAQRAARAAVRVRGRG
jgi:DNA-directed RNA polymerase specialized sigma24 family protein